MKLTDEQYEKIARVLDGEKVSLTQEEQTVLNEIQQYESRIGQYLPAALEQKVKMRAANRMTAALAGTGHTAWRIKAKIAAAAVIGATVAAAMMIALQMYNPPARHTQANLAPTAAELDRSWDELNALVSQKMDNAGDATKSKNFNDKVAELEKQLDDLNSADQYVAILGG